VDASRDPTVACPFKGETFKVKRISKSGRNAYGMADGHVNRHVWIKTVDLKKKR
jgi:hypothetical protein